MEDRGDWVVDTEGNLSRADGDGLKPPTDEFGRDDPASLERERRRREREARRGKSKKARRQAAPPAEAPPAHAARPKRARPRKAQRPQAAPPPAAAPQAPPKAPRRTIRQRLGRDGDGSQPKKPRGTYHRRRFLALGLVLIGVLVAWFLIAFFQPPPFDPGDGSGEAIVTVPEGATASDVADLLTKNDVVSNGTLFEWRLKLSGDENKILPGRYVLAHNMSYGSAIDKLTSSGGQVNVTIPEGEDRVQIASTIKGLGLSGDYLAASKSFKGFDPNKYGAKNPASLEGFLFPATYQLDPGSSVDQLVSEQLQAFKQNIAGVNMSYAKSRT